MTLLGINCKDLWKNAGPKNDFIRYKLNKFVKERWNDKLLY